MDGQGNLGRTWKVREKSGNLKTNGCAWQADLRIFIYSVQEGKRCTFSGDSVSPSPSSLRAIVKGKNLLPVGANSFL